MANPSVILDNGTGSIKAGFAGEEAPRVDFRTTVGLDTRNNQKHVNFLNFSTPEAYSGFKRSVQSKETKLNYPIHRGAVVDWDDMEEIWRHTFTNELHVDPKEYNLLLTEATGAPKPNREKSAQILFETFGFSALSIVQASLLPLYAAGRTTGIVLDCGEGLASTVPVWSGYPLPDASHRLDIGGRDCTEYLECLLREEGGFSSPHFEISRIIKEKVCFVPSDFSVPVEPTSFQLPDGETVTVKNAKVTSPELLFNPSIKDDTDLQGVHNLLYKSILKTEVDIRKDMYTNIILSGGVSLTPGFAERVEMEIRALAPPAVKVNVIAKDDRKLFTWIGGSILASLSNFGNLLISKKEYEEGGAAVVHRR